MKSGRGFPVVDIMFIYTLCVVCMFLYMCIVNTVCIKRFQARTATIL